jgi:hypothetical protein
LKLVYITHMNSKLDDSFCNVHIKSYSMAFLLLFYCCLLFFLFIKQIENDRCDATLGKMPFILRNLFNEQ